MISSLEVKNFKSIKQLKMDCRKVNIFIGKPNTGKSNILESVSIFSILYDRLEAFIRFENIANLFYDQDTEHKIEVIADDSFCTLEFEQGKFVGKGNYQLREKAIPIQFEYSFEGWKGGSVDTSLSLPIKFYRFFSLDKFPKQELNFLLPPKGENLLALLLVNKELRKLVSDLFVEYGIRLGLKPLENKIEVLKEIDGIIVSYPYSLVSDTLRRVAFYLVALETNKDSIILLEEPEAHSFPFYTKYLAERIALDETNQFFISTHNPYFLLSLLEKTRQNELGIFITYFEDYQTRVKKLSANEVSEFIDFDASIFFNLDRFLGEE